MPLYVEQRSTCCRLEIAYRMYEAELKRFLRRHKNLLRSPFCQGNLRTTGDYGLGSSVVEKKHRKLSYGPGNRSLPESYADNDDYESSVFAGVTMIGADEGDYRG